MHFPLTDWYQGPRENILEFFEAVGFKCPERKGVANFLQEVSDPPEFLLLMLGFRVPLI